MFCNKKNLFTQFNLAQISGTLNNNEGMTRGRCAKGTINKTEKSTRECFSTGTVIKPGTLNNTTGMIGRRSTTGAVTHQEH